MREPGRSRHFRIDVKTDARNRYGCHVFVHTLLGNRRIKLRSADGRYRSPGLIGAAILAYPSSGQAQLTLR